MRIAHGRRGDAERSTHGLARSLGIVLLAVVLVLVTIAGFLRSREATEARRVADDEVAQIALFEIRVELAWLHYDLITDALAGSAGDERFEPDFAAYVDERDRLLDEVRRLARSGGDVGPVASLVLEIHRDADVDRWPVDAGLLDLLHYESMPFEMTSGRLSERLEPHLDGIAVSMIPRFVLGDALSIAIRADDRPVPEWAAEYVDQTASIAIETPGWFGPARQSPMTNHVLLGPGDSGGVYRDVPSIVAAVESVDSSIGRAWDYDQWIVAGDLDSPAPLRLDELAAEVDVIATAFEAGFRAGLAVERDAIIRDAPGESAATLWFVAALAALTALASGLTVVMLRQWRRQRSLTQAAYVDGLTGAYNRRFLTDEIEGWCRRRVGHIAIAMVDLDRFKLVNDTWGHAAGDAVLIEAARRLALAAATTQRADDADAASAVVRIGGDEFLLAWVGSQPFDPAGLEQAVLAVAGPVAVADDEQVPIELSVGVATSPTPTQLDDLMRAADLAVYADKDAKRADPQRSRPPAMPDRS